MLEQLQEHQTIVKDSLLINDFFSNVEVVLQLNFGKGFSLDVVGDMRKRFSSLLEKVPYIGGSKNHLTETLLWSASALALYQAIQNRNKLIQDTGYIIYQAMKITLEKMPRELAKDLGHKLFTEDYKNKLRHYAIYSQNREYTGDWVCNFIEGNNIFDYGYDYTECGIQKFLRSQNADELTPYLCALDFLSSEVLETGLIRTSTLAEGSSKCDFRYRRRI